MSETAKNPFEPFFEEIRRIVKEEIARLNNDTTVSPTLLSAEQAAKLFNVPKTWIAEAARRGEIPSVRLGHYVRFKLEDLKAFIEMRLQKNL